MRSVRSSPGFSTKCGDVGAWEYDDLAFYDFPLPDVLCRSGSGRLIAVDPANDHYDGAGPVAVGDIVASFANAPFADRPTRTLLCKRAGPHNDDTNQNCRENENSRFAVMLLHCGFAM